MSTRAQAPSSHQKECGSQVNKELHWGPATGAGGLVGVESEGVQPVGVRRAPRSSPSERQSWPRPSMESAVGSPCQNRGPDFSALDPASSSLGHITAAAATVADGLHLLDQAPALGGFAQEPPVVVGIARGSILSLLLLLLGILHRPAPASETQSQASVAPSRAAHPHPP